MASWISYVKERSDAKIFLHCDGADKLDPAGRQMSH